MVEAEKLAEMLEREFYEPKTIRLIEERTVASALRDDFRAILEKLTEILETQRKMYEEYLRLKKRQVELLESATEEQKRTYD